jgi:hypothetical protein
VNQETRNPDQLRPHPLNEAVYGAEPLDQALLESIQQEGIITPLTVDQGDMILSGHRRWRVAQALGLAVVPVVVREIADPLDAERVLIEANRQRDKTMSQIHREADELERIIGAQARARMHAGVTPDGAGGRGKKNPTANWPEGLAGEEIASRQLAGSYDRDPISDYDPTIGLRQSAQPYGAAEGEQPDERGETVERVAALVGRPARTFKRERHVWNVAQGRRGDPPEVQAVARELVKKLDAKQITPSRAERDLRDVEQRSESHEKLPPNPPAPPPSTEAEVARQERAVLGADAAVNDNGVAKHALLRELGRDVRDMLGYREDEVCAAFARHPDMDHILTDLHRLRRFIANVERRCGVIVGGKGQVG